MSAVPVMDEVAELERRVDPFCTCGQPKNIGSLRCRDCYHAELREARALAGGKLKKERQPKLQLILPDADDDTALDHCPRDREHRIVNRVRGPWCTTCQGFLYPRVTVDGALVLAIWRNKP